MTKIIEYGGIPTCIDQDHQHRYVDQAQECAKQDNREES